uniref:GSKIP domain-containing protein n=1 Tax=Panagrolaimus sp. ES5 TaxID=591445 RepID=A0AC34FPM6_9BILA
MSITPNNSCYCPQITPGTESSIISGTPVTNGPNANLLADTLGVSPLYRQQDSARWQSAAHIYQSSRSHSPVPQATPQFPFSIDERENMCLTPQKLSQQLLMQAGLNNIGSPISLEDIASINRKKYRENGEKKDSNAEGGPLELEAIAAVHELSSVVKSISVSEILPRTPELIFVNVKTMEGTILLFFIFNYVLYL